MTDQRIEVVANEIQPLIGLGGPPKVREALRAKALEVAEAALAAADAIERPDSGDYERGFVDAIRQERTANQGRIKQEFENEQARRLRRDGRCPVCGAEA